MVHHYLQIHNRSSFEGAAVIIEHCCIQAGLTITLKGSLKKHPGCLHWHFKMGRQKGTLEFTLWEDKRQCWFSVNDRRKAEWIDQLLPSLKKELETKINALDKGI